MFGTFFNVGMILAGCLVGSVLKKGLKEEYHSILMQSMGLVALGLGINALVQHLDSSQYPVLFIVSLALGGVIGQKLGLESKFNALVNKYSKGDLAEGLATAILLFCIGTLSILGPIEAALNGDYTYLLANGMLDGITSVVLASTFGIGIAISAIILLIWQGSIYSLATVIGSSLNPDLLNEITIVGGVLIMASGLSILGVKKFNTLNLLPSLFIPVIAFWFIHLFQL